MVRRCSPQVYLFDGMPFVVCSFSLNRVSAQRWLVFLITHGVHPVVLGFLSTPNSSLLLLISFVTCPLWYCSVRFRWVFVDQLRTPNF